MRPRTLGQRVTRLVSLPLVAIVKAYRRFLSPLKPPVCRFRPTCSEYLLTALETKGLFRGIALGVRRIAKCHPFHPGGYDPVE